LECVLAVEAVFDVVVGVELVEDPVGVVLHGSGKYHYFVDLTHLANELFGIRPY